MLKPYYEDGRVKLYHGDCFEILPKLLAQAGGKPIAHHYLGDPPWTPAVHENARTNASKVGEKDVSKLITFDAWSDEQIIKLWSLIGQSVRRWAIAFMADEHVGLVRDWTRGGTVESRVLDPKAAKKHPLKFWRQGIWVKIAPIQQMNGLPGTGYEPIAIAHTNPAVSGTKMRWNGVPAGKAAVWTHRSCVEGRWPTEKPEPLIKDIINDFTDRDEVILDATIGSGTVVAMAKLLGRRAIGIEQNEEGLKIAIRRLKQETLF